MPMKTLPLIRLFTILVACTWTLSTSAQDLETISVKKGLKINGSVNLNSIGYYVDGIEQRRDPFNWFLTGNLNLNLFGYDAPFSFSYSNAGKGYSQPFNQFSFAPQYKWIKTYIGYNSMTFSPYTLAGHVFLGGGVELTPGKWKIAAMYGRLRKAVPFDPLDSLQHNDASFRRMGYGLKVGYESDGDVISTNIFTAKDDVNSIPFVLQESQLSPHQNVAMGLHLRKKFLKRFFIEAEYAVSALNKDTRANTGESDTVEFKPTHNLVRGLLPENTTSRYYDALNASIGYTANWYSLQLKFEQVAPEYQTLGAYYFNNDLRNFTIMPSVRLLKNTLNLSANVGIQQNNLDEAKQSTTERVVSSINANYLPNQRWNFVLTYSNFTSYTNIRPLDDPFFRNNLDTLNFYQVSQVTSASVIHMLGTEEKPQSIMLNVSHQTAEDNASFEGVDNSSNFITAVLSYSYSIVPSNTTLAVAGNVYTSEAAGIKTTYWGPTLSLTKAFFEKTLRGSWASSYNETSTNSIELSPVLSNRISLNFTPKPRIKEEEPSVSGGTSPHSFSLGINLLNRLKDVEQQPAYTELTGTFSYTYQF
jgi:hypothetical protein